MIGLLTTVFVVSVLGSLHCMGMCGPFALLAGTHGRPAAPAADSPVRHRWAAVAGYHAGRLATYTVLGLVCGGLGMIVDFGGALYGWQRMASYLAGGTMIAVGIWSLLRQAGWVGGLKVQWGAGIWQQMIRRVVVLPPLIRAWSIGALTTLMPCGWLYVFAITAAGVAHPLAGLAVMFAFWAGTVPILFVLMWGLAGQAARHRINVPLTTACLVIVAGVFTLMFRAPISMAESGLTVEHDRQALMDRLETLEHGELPCCQTEGSR